MYTANRTMIALATIAWSIGALFSPAHSDMVPLPYDMTASDEAYAINLVTVTNADAGFALLANDMPPEPNDAPGMVPVPKAPAPQAAPSTQAHLFWLYD